MPFSLKNQFLVWLGDPVFIVMKRNVTTKMFNFNNRNDLSFSRTGLKKTCFNCEYWGEISPKFTWGQFPLGGSRYFDGASTLGASPPDKVTVLNGEFSEKFFGLETRQDPALVYGLQHDPKNTAGWRVVLIWCQLDMLYFPVELSLFLFIALIVGFGNETNRNAAIFSAPSICLIVCLFFPPIFLPILKVVHCQTWCIG